MVAIFLRVATFLLVLLRAGPPVFLQAWPLVLFLVALFTVSALFTVPLRSVLYAS
jgi:hypothetical protein